MSSLYQIEVALPPRRFRQESRLSLKLKSRDSAFDGALYFPADVAGVECCSTRFALAGGAGFWTLDPSNEVRGRRAPLHHFPKHLPGERERDPTCGDTAEARSNMSDTLSKCIDRV